MPRSRKQKEVNNENRIDYVEHVRTAWNYINHEGNAAKYAERDIETIKTSILNTAQKYGVELEVT